MEMFRSYLWEQMQDKQSAQYLELMRIAQVLRSGQDVKLGSWCSPNSCHADVVEAAVEWLMKEGGSSQEPHR